MRDFEYLTRVWLADPGFYSCGVPRFLRMSFLLVTYAVENSAITTLLFSKLFRPHPDTRAAARAEGEHCSQQRRVFNLVVLLRSPFSAVCRFFYTFYLTYLPH